MLHTAIWSTVDVKILISAASCLVCLLQLAVILAAGLNALLLFVFFIKLIFKKTKYKMMCEKQALRAQNSNLENDSLTPAPVVPGHWVVSI